MRNKISELLEKLNLSGSDIYLLSTSDEFQNEYVPEMNSRMKWLTNFSGSNGIALLSKIEKIFFTDGRYLLQARKELSGIFKIVDMHKTSVISYIKTNFKDNKILIDTKTFKKDFVIDLIKICKSTKNSILHDKKNIVDQIWKKKPAEKKKSFFILNKKNSGIGTTEKIKKIIKINNADAIVITSPESVCWLLNIRGYDLPYTPVVLSRLILFKGKIKFFVDKIKLPFKEFVFKSNKISIFDISDFESELLKVAKKSQIFIDNETSFYFYRLLKKNNKNIKVGIDPCKLLKSQKNLAEIQSARLAHFYDGTALVDFFCWLEHQPFSKDLTESKVAKKLEFFRARSKDFFSLSFSTISATGANAAIIHYNYETKGDVLKKGQLYLCDSGAQYLGGTTDVTRTVILGNNKPKQEYVDFYTKILLGHINISMMKFPLGTKGNQIDSIGRYSLWKDGLDYDHGTGHGVGSFLSVHEGPQSIRKTYSDFELRPGMILSNEPGYYQEKKIGIRIENLIIVNKSKMKNFLEFETLTLCPYDLNLINVKLLNCEQKNWLNDYHSRVYLELSDFVNSSTKRWLKIKTKPV